MTERAYDSLTVLCVLGATVTATFDWLYGAAVLTVAAVIVLTRKGVMCGTL